MMSDFFIDTTKGFFIRAAKGSFTNRAKGSFTNQAKGLFATKAKGFFKTATRNLLLISMATLFSPAYADNHGESAPKTNPTPEETTQTMVTLKTSAGDIKISLNAEKAPVSVENFLAYAKAGQYDGTIFHRVIKGFMVQGGGFEPGMKQKPVNGPIVNEANNGLLNNKYTLAMARTSDPHSATAQFFINAKDNDFLNFSSETSSGWGYAVFGEVVDGQEVVDSIENVATGQSGPFGDVPIEDVIINSVVIEE